MKMKGNILVLGVNGMLGHVVYKELQDAGYGVIGSTRRHFDVIRDHPDSFVGSVPYEYVINCTCLLKHRLDGKNHYEAAMVNSVFPLNLAHVCKTNRMKLIHISTDGVFSGMRPATGQRGAYVETDPVDVLPQDVYGWTKAMGEPPNAMTLRMCIIGHERDTAPKLSLLEWAKKHADEQVVGYMNHMWNGITTITAARVICKIIDNDWYEEGARHIFSPHTLSKADLLKLVNEHLDLGLRIDERPVIPAIDRTLSTRHTLNGRLKIPSFYEQVKEL